MAPGYFINKNHWRLKYPGYFFDSLFSVFNAIFLVFCNKMSHNIECRRCLYHKEERKSNHKLLYIPNPKQWNFTSYDVTFLWITSIRSNNQNLSTEVAFHGFDFFEKVSQKRSQRGIFQHTFLLTIKCYFTRLHQNNTISI